MNIVRTRKYLSQTLAKTVKFGTKLAVFVENNSTNSFKNNLDKFWQHYSIHGIPVVRVVNIAILKVLQYCWQYFFGYCLHIANTF